MLRRTIESVLAPLWKSGRVSPARVIIFGFLLLILLGTGLLMLPCSTRECGGAAFSDALFTATSATCVTGLVVHDTASYWSGFGQLVILLLMAFGYFANGSMNDGLNTYVGLFTGRYGWTSAQLLTYSTYAGWASILVIIAYTQFARRRGARMTAIVAMTVAAAGMFLWARVTTQAMYFVSVLLLVSSSSAIMVIRDTTLNNWFPKNAVLYDKTVSEGAGQCGDHLRLGLQRVP